MLVLMAVTHVPTRFASPLGQPLGYVSAAEGFVMLSAYMAGMVYTLRARRDGLPLMKRAFLQRALTIYACQVALLTFLFTVVVLVDMLTLEAAIGNLLTFYRQNTPAAIVGAAVLLYNPPLLDILPMYVLFMLASPLVLQHGLRAGFGGLLVMSLLLWLAAQFGLGAWLYDQAVSTTGLPVPASETGSFSLPGWQFLWVLGLWMGANSAQRAGHFNGFPRPLVIAAALYAAVCLVGRHTMGQIAFAWDPSLAVVFDKWHLGPLRLLNFLALMVLAMQFAPWLKRHLPRIRFLETLGTASLPVFCAHLVLALLALAIVGDSTPQRPLWVDLLLLVGTFAALFAVARLSLALDRRAARIQQRTARLNATSAQSPSATRHTHRH